MKRNINKATHKGTCQICGRKQKLPYDKLSKHGYTVDMGWFNGVCSGAEHEPFEKSKDLIEGVIKSVQKQIEDCRSKIKKLQTYTSEVWVNVYYDYRIAGKNSGYYWECFKKEDIIIEINQFSGEERTYERYYIQAKTDDSKNGKYEIGCSITKTLDQAIKKKNGYRIRFHENLIKQMESYIDWQKERVEKWVECKLEEIK